MLKSLICFFLVFPFATLFCQQAYWQQKVNFTIEVTLNDKEHTLDGIQKMDYFNQSPDTLTYLWMHIWMNAFKNDKTAFCAQQLAHGNTKFYFSKETDRGYINRLNFQSDNKTLQIEDHPYYIDIIKVKLNTPLLPGESITILTPFHIRLPYNFSRGGHVNQTYQITQWFPKPAVYDRNGWHPMPYLDQGEFYSEFGDYDIKVSLPKNYIVAATGTLQNTEELLWLQSLSQTVIPIKKKTGVNQEKNQPSVIQSASEIKTLHFTQKNVHDFAWFANKEFIVKMDSVILPGGNKVLCQSYYTQKNEPAWRNSIAAIKQSILFRSKTIGAYPYETATAVDAPMGFDGGMEYPTITSISGSNYKSIGSVNGTIDHEIGHNWHQGILANNEREFPWLDEGLNSYYDKRAEEKTPAAEEPQNKKTKLIFPRTKGKKDYEIMDFFRKSQPINTSAQKLSAMNYGLVAYEKTADWLKLIEQRIGRKEFDVTMQQYFETWKFKHPSPEDFDALFSKYSIYNDSFKTLRSGTGPIFTSKKIVPVGLLPAFGFNKYDGFQLGLFFHDYVPVKTNWRFFVAPVYAFKPKKLNGLFRFVYNYYPLQHFERIDIGLSGSRFGMDKFDGDLGNFYLSFTKIAPFIRFTFKKNDPFSPIEKFIQFKHFNINEDRLQFNTVFNPPTDTFTVASIVKEHYYINQLQFTINKYTALYPYQLQIQMEQNKDLLRTTITAEQYFNYNEKEGLQIRLFAGKIAYIKSKTSKLQFANDRYALNLLAPKGNEDYTYSTYFYGRNEFEKLPSQQILQRDGFFKFRTDLLAAKPGRTDNWVASANLTSDIPAKLNPLSILPIKIPLRLFLDIGTYAEVWEKNATDVKFIYDAGLQLSLWKGTIEIYLPLVYSKLFTDYSLQMNGKKRSMKNLSFSINLNKFSLRKIIPQINY